MKRAENFKASFFRTLALKTTVGFERNIFLDHSLADVHPPKDITSNPVIPTSNEASPSKFRVRVCFSSFSLSLSLSLSLSPANCEGCSITSFIFLRFTRGAYARSGYRLRAFFEDKGYLSLLAAS